MTSIDQRINEAAENQSMRLTSSLVDADARARIYKDGGAFAKSLILKEFEPVIKALEEIQNFKLNWREKKDGGFDHDKDKFPIDIAREALKQWREKVGMDGN